MSAAKVNLETMSPREIVAELDKHIIGQNEAKRAVAVALRNRVRRQRLAAELRDEVAPKNIIMIGPTGVGKTEIARRLSKLSGAPFLKVEATKYTEVGYVGRDVESMIRDLMHVAINMVRQELQEDVRAEAERRVEEQILDLLLPGTKPPAPPAPQGGAPNIFGINLSQLSQGLGGQLGFAVTPNKPGQGGSSGAGGASDTGTGNPAGAETAGGASGTTGTGASDAASTGSSQSGDTGKNATREKMRAKLRAGQFEDTEVEIMVSGNAGHSIEIFSGGNMEEVDLNLNNLSNLFGGKQKKKRVPIRVARQLMVQEEMARLVDADRVSEIAKERVENMGIVFIDEIDKIASRSGNRGGSGPDVSREGVQRDILPIVEGSQINTKWGLVDTKHILFIAAGAFHMTKPSDLIPELQGRFPIRVELAALTEDDFYRILTQPTNAITKQYAELIKTEGVNIDFKEDALRLLAKIAVDVNSKTENIGARRLHTIMERLLEEVSFHAPDMTGQNVEINAAYVRQRLDEVVQDQDLSRYIL